MGVIAILLLVFEIILMFLGGVYFQFDILVCSVLIMVIFELICLIIIKRLSVTYGVFKKWFKGEVLKSCEWKELLISTRQLLIVNYFMSMIIWIIVFICNMIGIYIAFEFATYSIQMAILFNGIIVAPSYIIIGRKIKGDLFELSDVS